jgi:poly(beta-D-mannuronate) lyase
MITSLGRGNASGRRLIRAALLPLGVGTAVVAASGLAWAWPLSGPVSSGSLPGTTCTRHVAVSSSAALSNAASAARPGDCIDLASGTYHATTIKSRGTAATPVVISAVKPFGAVFSSGTVTLTGSDTILGGVSISGSANVQFNNAVRDRVTRSRFKSSASEYVDVFGKNGNANRIDHNEMGPKGRTGHFVQVGSNGSTPLHTLVDHNYFHDVAPNSQGGEALRVGGFGPSGDYFHSFSVFEYNLLVHCDGDAEIVSFKGSDNTFRYNTVRASRGMVNLRAGEQNSVYGNFIFSDGVAGAMGIRVSEDNHKIYNNYVNVINTPLLIHGGDPKPGSPPPGKPPTRHFTGHAQVRNAVIVNNTFIGASSGIDFDGESGKLPPDNLTFANNIVQSHGMNVSHAKAPTHSTYAANIVWGGTPGVTGPGFQVVDPKLTLVHGVMQPGPGSPALKAGSTAFTPLVTDDVEGRPRTSVPDIGAVQSSSSAAPTRLPLTTADVGPTAP